MEAYVDKFLTSCDDPERQLAVMIGFSTLTNQGYPVVPSVWRVVRHLQPVALQKYIDWLKDMFLKPDLGCCLDFSTNRQKQNQENKNMWVCLWCVFSLCFMVRGATNAVLKTILVNCNPLVGQIDCLLGSKKQAWEDCISSYVPVASYYFAIRNVNTLKWKSPLAVLGCVVWVYFRVVFELLIVFNSLLKEHSIRLLD